MRCKRRMNFHIEVKPLDELKKNLRLYAAIRMKLRMEKLPDLTRRVRLNKELEAEFADKVAILYYGWKNDCMENMLGKLSAPAPANRCCRIDFGDGNQRRRYLLELLEARADINRSLLDGRYSLICLYDDLCEKISAAVSDERLLCDYELWDLFFDFYEKYQDVNAEEE